MALFITIVRRLELTFMSIYKKTYRIDEWNQRFTETKFQTTSSLRTLAISTFPFCWFASDRTRENLRGHHHEPDDVMDECLRFSHDGRWVFYHKHWCKWSPSVFWLFHWLTQFPRTTYHRYGSSAKSTMELDGFSARFWRSSLRCVADQPKFMCTQTSIRMVWVLLASLKVERIIYRINFVLSCSRFILLFFVLMHDICHRYMGIAVLCLFFLRPAHVSLPLFHTSNQSPMLETLLWQQPRQ